MSQNLPRIPPATPATFTDEQKSLVGDWSDLNFSRVIVRHPDLYRTLIPLIAKLIGGSRLPPRDREIIVLRTLALCHETYEAHHHVLIARNVGMADGEIEAARTGGPGLPSFDQALVHAAEELVHGHCVSDPTWRDLAQRYSEVELMETVALVGGYTLMAMMTKSFDIRLEDPETFRRFSQLRKYS